MNAWDAVTPAPINLKNCPTFSNLTCPDAASDVTAAPVARFVPCVETQLVADSALPSETPVTAPASLVVSKFTVVDGDTS